MGLNKNEYLKIWNIEGNDGVQSGSGFTNQTLGNFGLVTGFGLTIVVPEVKHLSGHWVVA